MNRALQWKLIAHLFWCLLPGESVARSLEDCMPDIISFSFIIPN